MILLGSVERSDLQALLQRHISPERRRCLNRQKQQKLAEAPYDGHSKGSGAMLPKLKHESFVYVDEDDDTDEKAEVREKKRDCIIECLRSSKTFGKTEKEMTWDLIFSPFRNSSLSHQAPLLVTQRSPMAQQILLNKRLKFWSHSNSQVW